MSVDWADCSLGDMVTLQRGHDLPSHARKWGSVPIVSSSGLSGYHDTPKAMPPGVITGRYGTIGNVFYIEEPYWPLNTALYVTDFKGNDPRFIYYYLKTIDYQSVNDKSGVPGINRNDLHALPASRPSPDMQRSIVKVLAALDDRIALNEKLNAALEATAAAVFKSWFVDFDPVVAKSEGRKPFGMTDEIAALFPDRFAANGLPEGWKPAKVRDLLTLSKQQCNPMSKGSELFEHYSIPAFDVGQEPVIELGSSIKSNKFVVPARCILVSKLNPATPRIWWPQESSPVPRICSTEFMVAVPKSGIPLSYCFALSSSADVIDQLCGLVTGTSNSHQRVKPDDFLDMPVSLPHRELLAAFDEVLGPLYARRLLNQKQNQVLRNLRDAILPGLVSGELQIKEVQHEVAGVVG